MAVDTSVAHLCPTWAYDPCNPASRPVSTWQPKWDPVRGSKPMPQFEQFVADLLTEYGITWVYEPLLVPIHRPVRLPDPKLKHNRTRRQLRNDFYLPDYECVIEIYSGHSGRGFRSKLRHLRRMSEQHGIAFLLLGVREWQILERRPAQLVSWLENLPTPQPAAA